MRVARERGADYAFLVTSDDGRGRIPTTGMTVWTPNFSGEISEWRGPVAGARCDRA